MLNRVFLGSFIVSVIVSFGFFHSRTARPHFFSSEVPAAWVDPSIRSPYEAKATHRFWAGAVSSPGQFALDPLGSPELFSKFFPGYPDSMRTDQALWRDYFSRDFDVKVMMDSLSGDSPFGTTAYYSWAGCLDIFRRYGADVVIFGASDVAQAIPPDLLSQSLKTAKIRGLSNPRVLNCTGAAGVIDSFESMAREMVKSADRVGRPSWIIYGYSGTSAYVDSVFYDSAAISKELELRSYRRNVALGDFSQWNHPVASFWSWNDILPLKKVRAIFPSCWFRSGSTRELALEDGPFYLKPSQTRISGTKQL